MTREDGAAPVRLNDLGPDLVLVDRRTGEEIPVRVRRREPMSPETAAGFRAMIRDLKADLAASQAAREAARADAARSGG